LTTPSAFPAAASYVRLASAVRFESAIGDSSPFTPRGCTSLLPPRTRSNAFVPFVRFGPGARREILESCPALHSLLDAST
jgi:hypothetical protein